MTHSTLQSIGRFMAASVAAQTALLLLCWLGGCAIARAAGVPVPGGVIGLFALLMLLASGLIRPQLIERGAGWLLAHMLLFFVPAVVALMAHPELLGIAGLKVLVVIVGSTRAGDARHRPHRGAGHAPHLAAPPHHRSVGVAPWKVRCCGQPPPSPDMRPRATFIASGRDGGCHRWSWRQRC